MDAARRECRAGPASPCARSSGAAFRRTRAVPVPSRCEGLHACDNPRHEKMSVLRLELLGDYQIHSPAGALITLSAKKSQALLAYLAVRPTQLVSRDKMASLLWSGSGPEQARQSLRQLLSTLRKELTQISPDAKLLVEESDFLGVDAALLEADVSQFESLLG